MGETMQYSTVDAEKLEGQETGRVSTSGAGVNVMMAAYFQSLIEQEEKTGKKVKVASAKELRDEIKEIDPNAEVLVEEKKSKSKGSSAEAPKKKPTIGECTFATLGDSAVINVTMQNHAIKYKEQDWGIPQRSLKYNVELVKIPGKARNIARTIWAKGEREKVAELEEKAASGQIRLYEVVTYENIPANMKVLGYVSVHSKGYSVHVDENLFKRVNIEPESFKKKLREAVKKLVKINKTA